MVKSVNSIAIPASSLIAYTCKTFSVRTLMMCSSLTFKKVRNIGNVLLC